MGTGWCTAGSGGWGDGRRNRKQEEQLTLKLRKTRNLGARRIQSELKRLHEISLSLATVHKVLQKHAVEPVKKYRRKTDYLLYACPIPGERVQMDTCKIAPGLYQYTACQQDKNLFRDR